MAKNPMIENPTRETSAPSEESSGDPCFPNSALLFSDDIKIQDKKLHLTSDHEFGQTDWTDYSTLVVGIENSTNQPQKIKIRLASEDTPPPTNGGHPRGATFEATVAPNTTTDLQLPIFHLRYTPGTDYPPSPGTSAIVGRGMVDTSKVHVFDIETKPSGDTISGAKINGVNELGGGGNGGGGFGANSGGSETDGRIDNVGGSVKIRDITLRDRVSPDRWIDQYGQNSKVEFEGKVHSDDELISADKAEAEQLRTSTPTAERDLYQGWTAGKQLTATGFFRTEKVDDRWWFVDPDGAPYYSSGLNCVNTKPLACIDGVSGKAYTWLPEANDPQFSKAANSNGASLYLTNLIRKWGDDATTKAESRSLSRQQDWGFTSLGNWSDNKLIAARKLPYMSSGPNVAALKIPYIEGSLCDVFHPDFEKEAYREASSVAATKDDKWLVGYFVDNELPWTNMTADVLAAKSDLPAKQHLMKMLGSKYQDIESLNTAWGTTASSFDELRQPNMDQATQACKADLAAFRSEFAEKFYSVWFDAIKNSDPNHLILGSRFCDRHEEVVEACGRHTDVVSFNVYRQKFESPEFDNYYSKINKPFMIGEYSFNSLDTGNLTAAVLVGNQKERGIAYSAYTEGVAATKYFIGAHFYQYVDEPLTGRYKDRESSYNGFVSVADIPYKPIVEFARWTNSRIYQIHSGLEKPFVAQPSPASRN